MRTQVPPSTKKSGPTPSRQTEIGPLNSKDTQEGASIMSETTGTLSEPGTATDWHPGWCARTEHCTPNSPHGNIHYSRPRVLRKKDTANPHGTDGGENFRAELRVAEGTEAGESFDHSAELVIRNEEGVGDLELHIGANRMRRLAAWLTEMAEWVDAVHAGRDPQAVIQEQQEARQ